MACRGIKLAFVPGAIGMPIVAPWLRDSVLPPQLTKCMSVEFARRKQSVACVLLHPGTVDTDLSAPFQKVGWGLTHNPTRTTTLKSCYPRQPQRLELQVNHLLLNSCSDPRCCLNNARTRGLVHWHLSSVCMLSGPRVLAAISSPRLALLCCCAERAAGEAIHPGQGGPAAAGPHRQSRDERQRQLLGVGRPDDPVVSTGRRTVCTTLQSVRSVSPATHGGAIGSNSCA